jgi:hypothetical protein
MRILLSVSLLTLILSGCNHRKCQDPQPRCYDGVIVGDACMDGLLIDVQSTDPIGKPAGTLGSNVIAAVNFEDFAGMNKVGQHVFFTYRNDPARTSPNRICTANTVPLPVPHLVLTNLASSTCAAGSN